MLYGIYYAYWEKEWGGDFIPYIRKVKKLGFDILEVACHNFSDTENEYLYQLKEAADAEGIILTGGYGNDSTHNISGADPMIVKAAFDKFEKTFQKMNIAGIKLLGGSLYSYWPVDYSLPLNKKEDMKRGIENVRILADMAAEYEITLGMEVLNRFEGYMLNTCEEAVDFVSKIDRPNVKVMLDTFHMNIEEDDMCGAIRNAGDMLGHVHVGENNRKLPGMNNSLDWAGIGQALRDIHYDKGVVMEPFLFRGGDVGYSCRVWRDLSNGATQEQLDEYLKTSLKFLKEKFEA